MRNLKALLIGWKVKLIEQVENQGVKWKADIARVGHPTINIVDHHKEQEECLGIIQ